MNTEERKGAIEEATELIERAQELIDDVVKNTDMEVNYRAYGRYGFNRLLGNGNPYDSCIRDLIE